MRRGIELVKNKDTKESCSFDERIGYKATLKMREYGMLTRPLGDVIVFMPPLAATYDELTEMLAIIRKGRSEEHTSELQSRGHLVCRLLLEKKKKRADNDDQNI